MPEVTLRVGGYAPLDSTHSQALRLFGKVVERETDHKVGVEVMANILDEGRPASDLLDMTEAGELSMCYFSTSYLGSRVPELNALETPFLFGNLGHAHRALDGAFGAALTQATQAATGFIVLGYWDNGFRHLTNRLRPVRSPDDVRGMRVRLQPNAIHEAMIKAWGAIPVAAELSRGIELITSGAVDAQENPLANTVAYGVDRVHRFATMTGHLYGARGLYAHPGTMSRLSESGRSMVQSAARQAVGHQRNLAVATEVKLRAELEAGGMQFADLEPPELDAFMESTAGVVAAVRTQVGPELLDLAMVG